MSLVENPALDVSANNLTTQDKQELRQFLQSEEQKASIQSKIHTLTASCFKKCVTAEGRALEKAGPALERGEEGCVRECVGRFLDANMLVVRHLEQMRTST